jgi:hypothetical protein
MPNPARAGDDKSGKTTTLCVRRAVYIDPETGKEDPARRGVCSNYLCDSKPGDEVTHAPASRMAVSHRNTRAWLLPVAASPPAPNPSRVTQPPARAIHSHPRVPTPHSLRCGGVERALRLPHTTPPRPAPPSLRLGSESPAGADRGPVGQGAAHARAGPRRHLHHGRHRHRHRPLPVRRPPARRRRAARAALTGRLAPGAAATRPSLGAPPAGAPAGGRHGRRRGPSGSPRRAERRRRPQPPAPSHFLSFRGPCALPRS